MDRKRARIIKNLVSVISLMVILFSVVSITIASSYSVLVADDYSHGVGVGVYHVSFIRYLVASLRYAKHMYLTWQGTYFSMFIQALLSPINNFGMRQLRVVMVVNSLLFFISLLFMLLTIMTKIKSGHKWIKLFVIASICFMVTGYNAYEEIFFWFSGATSYSFPLSLLMLAIAFAIKFNEKNKIGYFVTASILGFLAVGGSLTVSGTGCYALLLVCLYYYLMKRKHIIKNYIMFAIWFIGAILNAVAPGNFVRHDVIDKSGVHPKTSFFRGCTMVTSRYQNFFNTTNFVAIMVCLLICGILLGKKYKSFGIKPLFVTGCAGIFMPFITAFPVALGYSSSSSNIPNRCEFLVDIAIILSCSFFIVSIGMVLERYFVISKETLVVFIVVSLLCTTLDGYGISDVKNVQIAKEVKNGTYKNHLVACEKFVDKLSSYERGSDVIIRREDFPNYIDNVYNFYLTSDPDFWVNKAVSEYYGFNSISVSSENE